MSTWAGWILKGRSQAVLIVSASGLLSLLILPFALISGAAVALITLRNAAIEVIKVLFLAFIVCAAFLWASLGKPELALQLLFFWSFLAISAMVLRKSLNLALAMLVLTVAALAVVVFIYAAFADPAELWKEVIIQSGQMLGFESDPALLEQAAAEKARAMTGMVAAGVLAGLSACLFLGRWWQAQLYNPGGFGREFRALNFGRTLSLVTLGLYGLFLWNDSGFVLSIWFVSAALYAFQGLALVHAFAKAKAVNMPLLVVFYIVLFLSLYAKLLLSIAGIVDAWIDGRRRWLTKASSA